MNGLRLPTTIALSLTLVTQAPQAFADPSAELGVAVPSDEPIWAKLKSIVIPLEFEERSLEEAVRYLREKAIEHDPEPDPRKKGINIVIREGVGVPLPLPDAKITMKIDSIRLGDALQFVCDAVGCEFRVEPVAVIVGTHLPPQMFTRSFKVPHNFLDFRFDNEPVADDPFAAADGTLRAIQVRNDPTELLTMAGITVPAGASAKFDPDTSSITIRNTLPNIELVEAFIEQQFAALPRVLRIRVELYEMPKPQALGIIRETDSKPSADAAIETVQELVKNGDARLLASPSLITRSGQRAKIEAGENVQYVASYKAVEGKDIPVRKSVLAGTSVEVDPTLGADSQTIDVRIAISMARGEPTIRNRKVVAPASGLEREVESVSISAQTLTLGFTTLTGQTQLIGNLQSEEVDNPDAVLAFVTATVTRAMRE